jgi:hypothetical protein
VRQVTSGNSKKSAYYYLIAEDVSHSTGISNMLSPLGCTTGQEIAQDVGVANV